MRQTISFLRTERVKMVLEVVQPLASATLLQLINTPASLGAPALGTVVSHEVSQFKLDKVEPRCECDSGAKPKPRRR